MVATHYDSLIAQLREAARPRREQPRAAHAYLETVRRHAYRVTDDQVAELRDGGLSEDEIFELTVAVAVAAGLERLEAGLRTLE
jgi:alkylhydroperoxidase family enzyme